MVFVSVLGFPHKFVCFVSTFNMVSEQDIEQILNNTTSDENQTEETATSFSAAIPAAVNVRISAAMDEWLRCLQTTPENFLISFLKLMFLPYLVMCAYTLNNTESCIPRNPISQPDLLLLSIVMFGDHPRSLPPRGNDGL